MELVIPILSTILVVSYGLFCLWMGMKTEREFQEKAAKWRSWAHPKVDTSVPEGYELKPTTINIHGKKTKVEELCKIDN